jgi:spermidine/putrescine transport system substrate-binding protein
VSDNEQIRRLMGAGRGRILTRRDLLRYAGAGAGAMGAAALLAACGVSGNDNGTTSEEAADIWATAKKEGVLNFANWPLYIDKAHRNGEIIHPTLESFEKETGITVNYKQVINENETFFATIQPQLSAGEDTGWDLMVLTFGPTLSRMIEEGFLIPLDHSYLDNFDQHCGESFRDTSYDPGNKYTIPWQSGFTGIGYDPNLTGREITSFNDLFDQEFAGRVGMFGDNLDLPNFAMVGMGIDPETSTPDDWRAAADKLIEQRDSGVVRKYYTQDYIESLQNGNVALTMAWSGDVLSAQIAGSPQLEFVIPDEGGLFWTDNMCIPAKAQHPVDAIMMMDYVYQPRIAADIAEWVDYMTPVPEVKDIIRQDIEKEDSYAHNFYGVKYLKGLLDSPFSFPSEEMVQEVHRYRKLTAEEEEEWNSIFQPIYQS